MGGCWLGSGAVVISVPRSSAQTVPGAGLCSALGAPRQRVVLWEQSSKKWKKGHRGTAVTKGYTEDVNFAKT